MQKEQKRHTDNKAGIKIKDTKSEKKQKEEAV